MFLKGLIIGISIAAPVGPISVLCIKRTLVAGRKIGFVSGLGAATADAIYASIAGFSLIFITNILFDQQLWLRLAGGLFLIYLGYKTFMSQPSTTNDPQVVKQQTGGVILAYISTLFLTLTNPLTILSFGAIFVNWGFDTNPQMGMSSAYLLILGVFTGSSFWWLLLSYLGGLFRTKLNNHGYQMINRISGSIILIFGILAIVSLIRILFNANIHI